MRIRELALALPLAMGIAACSTTSSQGNARAAPAGGETAAQAQAPADTSGNVDANARSGLAAHSDDQIVTGKITRLTPQSVTISTPDGQDKVLDVVPQTSVLVDGKDADRTALVEGLPARAAFSNDGDRDVAVTIYAVKSATLDQGAADETGARGTGGMHGSDSSGQPQGSHPDASSHTQTPQPR
jgi:hypothetical protein